ncbi:MAG: hypothetical protein A3E31_09730 [Candidatus Rokubacteria bacterium RIFCSPHIGHO2_12_FULL_73_22]|nr:MAG: hypothetical protein A3D33_12605 [Candidatus Rokubacteria bacterium RIFCSPHIGHO2_02_FULL_73_26]OGL03544.1 MAG: hypothetical protein A3E31_09730 [Candidatus Rokubacteria bacterium RIFCSPHIGHO2_12_FULL_73_22]OGL08902.1 MAG: hypothetical protein A3I14_16890 [Candidatus Rokubacteria bacterium RIFCSPLOWO2_02_FULL_73_56]
MGRWSTFFPTYIFGISIPSGKIALSRSSGDRKRWTTHSTSGSGMNGRPWRRSTGAHRLLRQPATGFVTTVLFSTGKRRARSKPSSRSVLRTPSTCQGWLEHAGKYFVHDRLSFRIRS